jgi:hypothetical protein
MIAVGHGLVWQGRARRGLARRGEDSFLISGQGRAWPGKARHGRARRGMARQGRDTFLIDI